MKGTLLLLVFRNLSAILLLNLQTMSSRALARNVTPALGHEDIKTWGQWTLLDDKAPVNVATDPVWETGRRDCPRVVSILENPRQGGVFRHCLQLPVFDQDMRTSRYQDNLGWQCVHEYPRSSFLGPRDSQTGRGLRALPSSFAPSSTVSSGHLTSCNDPQILLIIKINQSEDWAESKESLLLWHQTTTADSFFLLVLYQILPGYFHISSWYSSF